MQSTVTAVPVKPVEPPPPVVTYDVSFTGLTEEQAMILRGVFSDSSWISKETHEKFHKEIVKMGEGIRAHLSYFKMRDYLNV